MRACSRHRGWTFVTLRWQVNAFARTCPDVAGQVAEYIRPVSPRGTITATLDGLISLIRYLTSCIKAIDSGLLRRRLQTQQPPRLWPVLPETMTSRRRATACLFARRKSSKLREIITLMKFALDGTLRRRCRLNYVSADANSAGWVEICQSNFTSAYRIKLEARQPGDEQAFREICALARASTSVSPTSSS